MNFGSTEPVIQPSLWAVEAVFWGLILLTPWVVVPLVRWLGLGPRVGGEVTEPRVGFAQRFGDLLGWACVTAVFVVPFVFATAVIMSGDCVRYHDEYLGPQHSQTYVSVGPEWWLLALATLGCIVLRARWLRNGPSRWDVLHIAAHAP